MQLGSMSMLQLPQGLPYLQGQQRRCVLLCGPVLLAFPAVRRRRAPAPEARG